MSNNIIDDIAYETLSNFSKDKKNEVLNLSKRIVNDFDDKNRSSLLVGRIQSGKTTTFINVIAAAIHEKFMNVIILTGTKNDLNAQTLERVSSVFDQKTIYKDIDNKVFKVKVKKVEDDITNKSLVSGKYRNIIISKKGATTKRILAAVPKDIPTLIIDDESDHASNDTNKLSKKKDEKSATNLVLSKVNELCSVKYLAVTATPQTHVLMNEGDFNLPSNVYFIKPGNGYKGIKAFFEETSPVSRIISQHEADILRTDKGWTTKDISPLKDSVAEFLIKVWALQKGLIIGEGLSKEEQEYETFNMMININLTNFHQEQTHQYVSDYLDELLQDDDELEKKLGEVFAVDLLKKLKINRLTSEIANEIKSDIKDDIIVISLNKDSTSKEIPEETSNIIIGGHSLSRGLTIPNLIISFYLQDPKVSVATTTLQRARWFGYRSKYFDFTRVFLTSNIIGTFKELLTVEDILWDYAGTSKDHNIEGLQEVFSNYRKVAVAPAYIGKYKIQAAGFKKRDSNFKTINNPTHEDAFKWSTEKVIPRLLQIDKKQKGIRTREFDIDELLKTIPEQNDDSILSYLISQINFLKESGHKTVRIICFLNNSDNIDFRGSQRGWDLTKKYEPSGRNSAGKLKDEDYSLNKKDKSVPDIQLHPIMNKNVNNSKYLFYSVYANLDKSIIKTIK